MAYPNKPQITYSYTGFQQSQGNNSFPGTQLDADLANLKQFASTTVDFLALFVNSDGSLKSTAIIGSTALSDAIAQAAAAAATAVSSAASAQGRASQAQSSADAAATSAQSASDTLASLLAAALAKSQNLADLPDASAARTNLGLTAFATKASLVIGDFSAGLFTADTDGRAPFADGIWTTAKIANDAVDYTKVAAGAVVQVANVLVSTSTAGTTLIPADDTIPQITEGNEYMTLAFTPKAATNKLKIEVVLHGSHSVTSDYQSVALFQDAVANALTAAIDRVDSAGVREMVLTHFMTAGTTSAITFRVRAGGNSAGTFTFNGTGGSRRFGGVMTSSITVTEIKA